MTDNELNKLIARRISHYMDVRGKTQLDLAEHMGVSQATVSNWCNGVKMPRMDKIDRICEFFNVPRSALMNEPDDENNAIRPDLATLQMIPLFGSIPAGKPNLTNNDVQEYIPYNPDGKGQYFSLTVRGASMEPTLMDGDIVYVRCQQDVKSGDIAIVSIGVDSGTCKEVQVYENGIMLVGHNHDAYTPRFFTADEVRDLPVTIQGKVVGMSRKFR